ncbi:MAG: molecular chaperone TorD family protein, partial [Eggerthella lenta]
MAKEIPWKTLSEAYAFIGNSLLKPMTMTSTVGLDPAFWEAFPSFDDEAVAEAVAACARYAEGAVQRAEAGEDEPQRAAVEYTKLFVGPPSPAAAPWETMYRGKNVTVGFGQATFEMRELLREAGLEVRNVNNQYEDHLGIELLYLSSLCARADADAADAPVPESVADFIEKHPLSWV